MLKERGFKIIFLSAGDRKQLADYENELKAAGYDTYEKLILRPDATPQGPWKFAQRQTLAETYDIVGCIGDLDTDFYGGYTGKIIHLPNYLYR